MLKLFVHLIFTGLIIFNTGLIAQEESSVSDEVLLELYRGARVVDVVDGLVTVGYAGIGVTDPEISPEDIPNAVFRVNIC